VGGITIVVALLKGMAQHRKAEAAALSAAAKPQPAEA
jgi:hypothetical protein